MVIIQKESLSWKQFDSETALLIWRKCDKRNIVLPIIKLDGINQMTEIGFTHDLIVKEGQKNELCCGRRNMNCHKMFRQH